MASKQTTQAQHNRRSSDIRTNPSVTPQGEAAIVRMLESTIEMRVVGDLRRLTVNELTDAKLTEVVHNAVHDGIMTAVMGTTPSEVRTPAPESMQVARTAPAGGPVIRGEKVRAIWDALDGMGKGATLEAIRKVAKAKRWNDNTARVQFYRWRAARGA